MTKKIITNANEQIIVMYHKTHTDTNTAQTNHIGFNTLRKILEKYGETMHSKEENKKLRLATLKENCLEKYGVTNKTKLLEVQQKMKASCLEKYGVDNIFKADVFKESSKQTCIAKYGVPYASQSPQFRENVVRTCIERYGASCVFKNEDIKAKIRSTCLDKYGVPDFAQSDQFINRVTDTCLKKFGTEWYTQSAEYAGRKKFKIFKDADVYFDSFPELCFYLYHLNSGHTILRNPIRLNYHFNDKSHFTFVDFSVDGNLFEIKSDYLYSKMLIINTQDNAKLNCLLEHNVKILKSDEYKNYENWFRASGLDISNYKC